MRHMGKGERERKCEGDDLTKLTDLKKNYFNLKKETHQFKKLTKKREYYYHLKER